MEENIKARRQAVKALDRIINQNAFSNEVIRNTIDNVDVIDRGIYRKLVYGVVENLYYIDYMINKLSKIKLKKLNKDILNILRIGVYELAFLDTKAYAAINEAVNSAKKFHFKSKGFVNGILRNLDRNLEEIKKIDLEGDDYLSIRYSTNMEIIKYLRDNYENYEDIVFSFTSSPKLSIRINSYLTNKEDLKDLLEKQDLITIDSQISPDALIVDNPVAITETKEFKDGLFTIQDQASILVSNILNPKEESLVLDLCAAPGSKSTHLAQIMKNTGTVYANDISEEKNFKIEENFSRMGLENYKLSNINGRLFNKDWENKFDYILVDAPCSGLGVVKRKPEIKLNRSLEDIKDLALIQEDIMNNAYRYLKNGGYLVYSTCTLGRLENQDIIDKFLNKHSDMSISKIDGKDYKEILPTQTNDGFFICKMLKA